MCSVHVWIDASITESSVNVTLTFTPKTLSYAPFSVQAVLLRQWCIGIHFSKFFFFYDWRLWCHQRPKSKEFRLAFWLQQLIKNGNRNTFFRSTMGKPIISLLLVIAIVTGTSAFLGPNTQSSAITLGNRKFLSLSSSPDNNDSYGSDVFPKSRTDIRNFLTQRSIQSFAFLLNQCREEHTVRWLEVSRRIRRLK